MICRPENISREIQSNPSSLDPWHISLVSYRLIIICWQTHFYTLHNGNCSRDSSFHTERISLTEYINYSTEPDADYTEKMRSKAVLAWHMTDTGGFPTLCWWKLFEATNRRLNHRQLVPTLRSGQNSLDTPHTQHHQQWDEYSLSWPSL